MTRLSTCGRPFLDPDDSQALQLEARYPPIARFFGCVKATSNNLRAGSTDRRNREVIARKSDHAPPLLGVSLRSAVDSFEGRRR